MTRVIAFAPLIGRAPRVLVLGSLPSVASLAANEYYAHPRNAFWRILASITGCDAGAPYAARTAAAERTGIAIWDVLAAATRPGSLDTSIDVKSATTNDFGTLLQRRRTLRLIVHNGQSSAALYERLVIPRLDGRNLRLPRVTLPSTSPANAGQSFEQKAAIWLATLRPAIET
ncbi:MAG TPA: DNA-deoxyinosine glycosylase [Steroidobacteraceae bacterium]|nr:DNA-deoxyinosine glycosylase [Steroidobacteraceae bacterium]HRX89063.1 DNA-deoxyinosine glycosylase [Steroidobacteraceae bacterium]